MKATINGKEITVIGKLYGFRIRFEGKKSDIWISRNINCCIF